MRQQREAHWKMLMALLLGLGLAFQGLILPAQAESPAQARPPFYGFFAESYIEGDGAHSQGSLCPVNADGTIDEAHCQRFRVDIRKAVDTKQDHLYGAYGSYVFFDRGQPFLQQSLYEADGTASWYRTCAILGEKVDWAGCSDGWSRFDVSSLGFGPLKSYGSFTYDVGLEKHLVQHLIGTDDRIWGRSCPTSQDGKVDWNQCEPWHHIQHIPDLYGKHFTDYGAYTYRQGDRTFLKQVLIDENGFDEFSRTCEIRNGLITSQSMWGLIDVEPEYSLDFYCGDGWMQRDLRTVDWTTSGGEPAPQSFTGYDAYYFSREEAAQRQLKNMIDTELEGYAEGTTGGLGGRLLIVTSTADRGTGTLRWALEQAAATSGPEIIVFDIEGTIVLGNMLSVPSNTSIDARGHDVMITGNGLEMQGVENVILSNLTIQGPCLDEDEKPDAIRITDNEDIQPDGPWRTSRHIWVHHVTLRSFCDGLLDISKGSTDITISWSRFEQHRKCMLIGDKVSEEREAWDRNIRVTLHHNLFNQTRERSPRLRYGMVDAYNNYLLNWGDYGMASSMRAKLRIQNNIFEAGSSTRAVLCSIGDDPKPGLIQASGNLLLNGARIVSCGTFTDARPYPATIQPADEELRRAIMASAGHIH
jgi:pectate lyase